MSLFIVAIQGSATPNNYSTHSEWLMEIDSSEKRFKAIQGQLRGFDVAMVEVGYRYEKIKEAIVLNNYDLALYHLHKIKRAIKDGYTRRPMRKESSDLYFLNGPYMPFEKALLSKNNKEVKKTLENIRVSCNACHVDQKVSFIKVK